MALHATAVIDVLPQFQSFAILSFRPQQLGREDRAGVFDHERIDLFLQFRRERTDLVAGNEVERLLAATTGENQQQASDQKFDSSGSRC